MNILIKVLVVDHKPINVYYGRVKIQSWTHARLWMRDYAMESGFHTQHARTNKQGDILKYLFTYSVYLFAFVVSFTRLFVWNRQLFCLIIMFYCLFLHVCVLLLFFFCMLCNTALFLFICFDCGYIWSFTIINVFFSLFIYFST